MGTLQQAHVAKTIVFTMVSVDFRGVAFAPQKWSKCSRRWATIKQDGLRVTSHGPDSTDHNTPSRTDDRKTFLRQTSNIN